MNVEQRRELRWKLKKTVWATKKQTGKRPTKQDMREALKAMQDFGGIKVGDKCKYYDYKDLDMCQFTRGACIGFRHCRIYSKDNFREKTEPTLMKDALLKMLGG